MADDTIEAVGRAVAASDVDKLMCPDDGVTKGDVIRYYLGVAGAAAASGWSPTGAAPLPDGIGAAGFVQ